MAALFLALAKNSTDYFTQAENYYKSNNLAGQDDIFNWDSKTPGLAVLFAQISASRPSLGGSISEWQNEAERYFDKIVNGESGAEETKGRLRRNFFMVYVDTIVLSGGLLFYDEVSDEASLNPVLNLAMLLSLYSPLATSQSKSWSYTTLASKQLNYTLGSNPMSCPYVVGVSLNSPQNPHSALASGGSDIGKLDTEPPQEAYVLYGAVVGGPDKRDRFFDIRSDWPQTEPALDINAPMLTLAALVSKVFFNLIRVPHFNLIQHAMNDSFDPFYTSLADDAFTKVKPSGFPCDAAYSCGGVHALSTAGKIAMGVVITVVGLAIVGLLFFSLFSRRRTKT
jgi:endoglucanase